MKNNPKSLNDGSCSDPDLLFLERFKRRKWHIDAIVQHEEQRRPPNPNLSPAQVVEELLDGLRHTHNPIQNFGITTLVRASTPSWRNVLFRSVGATPESSPTHHHCQSHSQCQCHDGHLNHDTHDYYNKVVLALEAAMGRPNNQFRILLGKEDPYRITFPTDHVDYMDGTAWIECRLRSQEHDALLVAIGWSLVQQDSDANGAAWFIDGVDWQDFRDPYRPGIGREEWERICG